MARRLKMNWVFRGVPPRVSFGFAQPPQMDSPPLDERYFAFATARGSRPSVFDYGTDEDGVAALSNLIRSEEVLAVIIGRRVNFQQASVVELSVGRGRVEHRLRIKEDL